MTDVTTHSLFDQLQDAATPSEKTAILLQFMHTAGQTHYDEVVTQLQHAVQCAALADEAGVDDATVIAALLHDFGHFLQQNRRPMATFWRRTSDARSRRSGSPAATFRRRRHRTDPTPCRRQSVTHARLTRATATACRPLPKEPAIARWSVDGTATQETTAPLEIYLESAVRDDRAKVAESLVPTRKSDAPRITEAWRNERPGRDGPLAESLRAALGEMGRPSWPATWDCAIAARCVLFPKTATGADRKTGTNGFLPPRQPVRQSGLPGNGVTVVHDVLALYIDRVNVTVGMKEERSRSRHPQDEHALVEEASEAIKLGIALIPSLDARYAPFSRSNSPLESS